MRRYTVLLYPEEGQFTVVVPAFGHLATYGDTFEQALEMAKDLIEVATRGLIEDGQDVPDPDGDALPIVTAVEVGTPVPSAAT
jgi:antitoxin HicB